jgi:hypothetical protein
MEKTRPVVAKPDVNLIEVGAADDTSWLWMGWREA